MTVVVAADLRGIQSFVYYSRQLLDAIGRAALVAELTDPQTSWLAALLTDGEVVVAGAGALVVSFADVELAQQFTAEWTRKVYDTSDHLQAVIAHLHGEAVLPGQIAAALRRARATADTTHEPVVDPGFFTRCAVTGWPATTVQETTGRGVEVLSGEVIHARELGRQWHVTQSRELLPDNAGDPEAQDWVLSNQLELLGRQSGDISKLAVVHADINGLGAALSRHATTVAAYQGDPAQAPLGQRQVSAALQKAMDALHRHVVIAVLGHAEACEDDWRITGFPSHLNVTAARDDRRRPVVPIRPVVAAGDDLTLVCDARLAFSITRMIFNWLDADLTGVPADDPRQVLAAAGSEFRRTGSDGSPQLGLTVGVGIATFNVGAPFATAYEAAAQMCDWAKDRRSQSGGQDHVLAWTRPDRPPAAHLTQLEALQKAGLTRQPYPAHAFRALLEDLLGDGDGSLRSTVTPVPRTWVKSLHTLVHGGPAALRAEITRRGANSAVLVPEELLKRALNGASHAATDWTVKGTSILDAIALMDLHLDLHPDIPTSTPTSTPTPTPTDIAVVN